MAVRAAGREIWCRAIQSDRRKFGTTVMASGMLSLARCLHPSKTPSPRDARAAGRVSSVMQVPWNAKSPMVARESGRDSSISRHPSCPERGLHV